MAFNYTLPMELLIFVLCGIICVSHSANVLGIFFHGGRSHHILGEVLCKELARKGHNITMVSPFPLKERIENYTDIFLPEVLEDQKRREPLYLKMNKEKFAIFEAFDMMRTQVELTISNKDMQNLVNSATKFDVIIMDWFISYSLLIYGHVFDAPVILISSGGSFFGGSVVGNTMLPSFIPNNMIPLSNNMTFLERTLNSLIYLGFIAVESLEIRYHEVMLKKYFVDAPSYKELTKDVALVLSNSHYSFESPRPLVPNLVPIGGFHIQKPKTLPPDLEQLISKAEHGVILFSLGSIMKSKNLPMETRQHIIKAFSKIDQLVLWKWEEEPPPNLPNNVIIKKSLPQNDILAHPNVKLFISHGGLLSTYETIYHAVPIIGIPIFGDQRFNIVRATSYGFALKIELADITETTLLSAIREILENPQYAENIRKRSRLLRGQPISALENAVFWVEHVIENKGAPHLVNAGIHLSWFQYWLLDVIVFLIFVIFIMLVSFYFSVKAIYRLFKYFLFGKHKTD